MFTDVFFSQSQKASKMFSIINSPPCQPTIPVVSDGFMNYTIDPSAIISILLFFLLVTLVDAIEHLGECFTQGHKSKPTIIPNPPVPTFSWQPTKSSETPMFTLGSDPATTFSFGFNQPIQSPKPVTPFVFKPGWWATPNLIKYLVTVRTGDISGSGTDANVFIHLFGDAGETGDIILKGSDKKIPFLHGQVDNFVVDAVDVGKIQKLRIGHGKDVYVAN
jgi:hypothetical protein